MKKCKAITQPGTQCIREARLLGYCVTHFRLNIKIKKPKLQKIEMCC